MDLPLSRLGRAQVIISEDQTIRVHDVSFNNDLLVLSNRVQYGQYVAVVGCVDADGDRYRKLMAITSIYDFETLGRRPLLRDLDIRLKEEGFEVEHIGLYHKKDHEAYIGKELVVTHESSESGETLVFELEVA